jgi:hypothetical protein
MFYRKLKVSGASTWRLRWTDGTEARGTRRMDARSRRWRTNRQLKVAVSVRHAAALHPKDAAPVRHAKILHWPEKSGALM